MRSALSNHLINASHTTFAAKLQRLRVRRSLVVAGALWLVIMTLAFPYLSQHIGLLLLIDAPLIALTYLLILSIYSLFELPDDELDELQLSLRNHAYKKAYGFTLVFIVVIATLALGSMLGKIQLYGVTLMTFIAAALAPRAYVAWTLQNDVLDPETRPN